MSFHLKVGTALLAASLAVAQDVPNMYTATAAASIAAAQATALTSSPTSSVKGKVFDRFVTIWLENTDYSMAAGDPNMQWLAQQGITLENYFGTTHPSQPNYISAVGGDNFGLDSDNFWQMPANVSTLMDLLDDKGISWGEYQEDMPYSGFENDYKNQVNGANDYVRKHNPNIHYNSVAGSITRLSQDKNLTQFYKDLSADKLPQWVFITPNMTSDGHDTSVTTAGTWTRNLLEPLLNNPNFMKNTLVLVTFDENETYTTQNKVFSILLGDAVPSSLKNTVDTNFYNHYSEISTVEANWDLYTLGRWDAGANVFDVVGKQTGDKIRQWSAATGSTPTAFFNQSYPGPISSKKFQAGYVSPNVSMVVNGRAVQPAIVRLYKDLSCGTYYNDGVEIPDGLRYPTYGVCSSSTSTSSSASSSSVPSTTKTSTSFSTSASGSFSNSSALTTATSSLAMTTSTAFTTITSTITSCAATVTNCPATLPHVTTVVIALYTTVCPVSAVSVASASATTSTKSSSAAIVTISQISSVVYTTTLVTVTACPSTVSNCPASSTYIVTSSKAISTALFPVTVTVLPAGSQTSSKSTTVTSNTASQSSVGAAKYTGAAAAPTAVTGGLLAAILGAAAILV